MSNNMAIKKDHTGSSDGNASIFRGLSHVRCIVQGSRTLPDTGCQVSGCTCVVYCSDRARVLTSVSPVVE